MRAVVITGPNDGSIPPFTFCVQDPVLWLEHNDRDPELHATVNHLIKVNRHAEAVMCLQAYVGRTAPIRAQVDGWDGPWAWATTALRQGSLEGVRTTLGLLMATESTPRGKS